MFEETLGMFTTFQRSLGNSQVALDLCEIFKVIWKLIQEQFGNLLFLFLFLCLFLFSYFCLCLRLRVLVLVLVLDLVLVLVLVLAFVLVLDV